jgi:hypothetical protein
VLLLAALCPLLGLQDVGAAAPAPVQSVRFTVFSLRPVTDVAFQGRGNAAPEKLRFFPALRSSRYEYRGPMPLRFVDPETRAVVAEAIVPPGVHDALLLFSPIAAGAAGAGKLRYQVAVVDDGTARHGVGGLAIINLSGLSLSGTVNDRAVVLQPGLNPTIAVGGAAQVRFTTVFKQRPYESYSGAVKLGRDERALLILFPPFYPGALEVQSRLLLDRPATGGGAGRK